MRTKLVRCWERPRQPTPQLQCGSSGSFKVLPAHSGIFTHSLPIFGEEDLGSLHVEGHGLNAAADPVPGVALGPELAALGSAIVQPVDRVAGTHTSCHHLPTQAAEVSQLPVTW